MESAENILNGAEQLFFKMGFKSVTMGEVATHLGMSKKTIYQHFAGKNELVKKVIDRCLKTHEQQINNVLKQANGIMEEIAAILSCIQDVFVQINPLVIHDIKTNYVGAWNIFQKFKSTFLVGTLENLLIKGKLENLVRPQLDERIISLTQINLIEASLDGRLFPVAAFDTQAIQHQLLKQFYFGICIFPISTPS
ncbi:MAG: TetR/AcrR family transcriptional regulator [Sphingobacteriaceae bacterium]|nr:MAG: TetR/AcrR family transcriptional regulator [Sphingobacteriaceae bacterium]